MSTPLLIARTQETQLHLLSNMANRHGLIEAGGVVFKYRRAGVYGGCQR